MRLPSHALVVIVPALFVLGFFLALLVVAGSPGSYGPGIFQMSF